MADVFISYSRDDRATAQRIATSLEAEGFSVWWDAVLQAGDAYDEVTEDNLRDAAAVVVLWSAKSARSKWVRAEATMGERHSTLVPAIIEACDRPLRFELIQTADLIHWRGDRTDENWRALVSGIRSALAAKNDGRPADAPAASGAGDDTIETEYWSTVKDTDNPSELEAYLKRYANGHFVDVARARLAALRAPSKSVPPPAPATVTAEPAAGVPRQLIALAIAAASILLGMTMLLLASALHVGWFRWTPTAGADLLDAGAKEIGYFAALNWSIGTLLLIPAAWTLLYLSFTEMNAAWDRMAARRMIVTRDFAPIAAAHPSFARMRRHIRLTVLIAGGLAAAVVVALAMSDYDKVAGRFYTNTDEAAKIDRIDETGYALGAPDIDRDWMVAALLTTPEPAVDAAANRAFGAVAYLLYPGLGIGSLVAFGIVVIGFAATFMGGIAENYGLRVIPDLNAEDRRKGLESIQRFFAFALAAGLIGCVSCFLLALQNLYLRSPAPDIITFAMPDFGALASHSGGDDAIGFIFADALAKGTRNVYAWIFGFFGIAGFIGGLVLLLRQGVRRGRAAVLRELRANGRTRLAAITDRDENELRESLQTMQTWPLGRPGPRAALVFLAAFVAAMIYYKLGALLMPLLCAAAIWLLWPSTDAEEDT